MQGGNSPTLSPPLENQAQGENIPLWTIPHFNRSKYWAGNLARNSKFHKIQETNRYIDT